MFMDVHGVVLSFLLALRSNSLGLTMFDLSQTPKLGPRFHGPVGAVSAVLGGYLCVAGGGDGQQPLSPGAQWIPVDPSGL